MSSSDDLSNSLLYRVIDRIISFFHVIAMVTLCVIAALLIYDVVMRFVFNNPTDWVLDVVQLAQVTFAFTAAAPILRDGGHINMELMQTLVGKRAERRMEILSNSICAAGSLWMAILGWRTFSSSYQISESSYGITLPLYPWKFLVPLCFFILALQFFGALLKNVKK